MTSKDFLIITILLGTCLTACQATSSKSTAPSVGKDSEAISPSYPSPSGMAITVPPASGVPTLYAIIIADTRNHEIGKSTQADLDHIKTLVENISKHTQLPNHTLIIQGEQLSRQAVVNLLTQLSVTGQDMVIFYYSGHGTRGRQAEQRESKWPYLCVAGGGRCSVKDNRLDLDEVVDSFRQKGPRFFIVMADACNDLIPGGGDKNWEFPGTSKPDNYRKLFLEPSGSHIIASSSKAGQVSIGEEFGGKFTNQFLKVLYQELAAVYPARWDSLMQRAVEEIPYQDREGEKIQQPQFDFLPHDVAPLSPPTPPLPIEEPTKPSPPVNWGEIHLEISPSNRLRPGDAVQLTITSAQGGYLFVFDVEHKDGGDLWSPVFPNPVYQERSGKAYFQLLAEQKFLLPDERYFDLEAKLRAPQEVGPRSLVALLVKTDRDLEKVRQLSNQPVSTLTDWLNQNLQKDQWVMTTITYEITQ